MKLQSIQCLRAVAAVLVVAEHTKGTAALYASGTSFLGHFNGLFGVDLFFVISGFIMYVVGGAVTPAPAGVGKFLLKRCLRIFPLYWIYTSFMIVLIVGFPLLFRQVDIDISSLSYVIASFLLMPARAQTQQVHPVISVGWTLYYEMFFYLVFGLLLLTSRRTAALLTGAVFALAVCGGFWLRPHSAVMVTITDPLLLEFVLGMIVGWQFAETRVLPWSLSLSLAVVGILLLPWTGRDLAGLQRVVHWGLPGAAIVLGGVNLERAGYGFPSLIARIGDASYSVYLSHVFTLPAFGKFWMLCAKSGFLADSLFVVLSIGVATAFGTAGFYLLERPTLAWARSKVRTA